MARGALATLLLAALGGASGGCTPMPAYQVIRSDVGTEMPKQRGCGIELLTRAPRRRYEQIGIIEPETLPVRSEEEFRALVREPVCAIGGDAIITEKKSGTIVGGAIIRYFPGSD